MRNRIITALILVLVLLPASAFAAWSYTETFNTLTTATLDGQDGWTSAERPENFNVQESVTQEGAKAVSHTANTEARIQRTISSVSSGVARIEMRKSTTASLQTSIRLLESTTLLTVVKMGYAANLDKIAWITAGTTETTIQAYSADTWYTIDTEFDCSTDQYRVRIEEGTWTSWGNLYNNGTCTNVDVIQMRKEDSGTAAVYWDSIGNGADAVAVVNQATEGSFIW